MNIETVRIHAQPKKRLKFPAAYKHIESGHVVVFFSRIKGVVVLPSKTAEDGKCSSDWFECEDSSVWTPVNLTIRNPNVP